MRQWSKKNLVFISEEVAPKDFKCIWKSKPITRTVGCSKGNGRTAVEKLFIHKSWLN